MQDRLHRHARLPVLQSYCNGQGNYVSALFDLTFLQAVPEHSFPLLWDAVLAALPPVDTVYLADQPDDINGLANTFLTLPHVFFAKLGRWIGFAQTVLVFLGTRAFSCH